MPTTYELTREVADHELLLVFNSDDECSRFREWLEGPGWDGFKRYCEKGR
jgi:hypothetical protein